MNTRPPRLLVIGIGPHARTFYLPALRELEAAGHAVVAGLIDLEPQRECIEAWCRAQGIIWPRHWLAPFCGEIPAAADAALAGILGSARPDGVIISTDPLNHKHYALWAMRHGLHILLDKPVTTTRDAVTSAAAAAAIETDYDELAAARAAHHGDRAFVLCAHRRFHPGFDLALGLVRETARATGCPVTHVHCYHSDGQWRLPAEILRQDHHSYHQGHGKLSHSGFHFLDTLFRLRAAGAVPGKEADSVAVSAALLQPDGYLALLTREDHLRLFGPGYAEACPWTDEDLMSQFATFGELDAEATFEFQRGGRVVGLASASLLHGGFSRRSWPLPGEDLYKANGRVKHESHRVHLGPFLGLQIHSCQAKDKHAVTGPGDELPGGNNHFEVWIFRNTGMIGGEPFERVTFRGLPGAAGFREDRLFIEQVKRGAIEEFLRACGGERHGLRSDFSDHRMPVRLMSAVYRSHVAKKNTGNPLVTIPWEETQA